MKPNQYQNFILWKGGECPLDHETRIDALLRNGQNLINVRAGSMAWGHEQIGSDVIYFRTVPTPPPVSPDYIRAMEDIKRIIRADQDIGAYSENSIIHKINALVAK